MNAGSQLRIVDRALTRRGNSDDSVERKTLHLNCSELLHHNVRRIEVNVVSLRCGRVGQACRSIAGWSGKFDFGNKRFDFRMEVRGECLERFVVYDSILDLQIATPRWIELGAAERDVAREISAYGILRVGEPLEI